MRWGIPRLDTYVAPDAAPAEPPVPPRGTPAAVEATLAEISDEVTRDAIERRTRADAANPPT
jgi:hypothetical protein